MEDTYQELIYPTRVITSGCNKAIEDLSIIEENMFYDNASEPSRIKDTNHMLDFINNWNCLHLPLNSILVSFDIINMFPNIDNYLGLSFVKKYLDLCSKNIPPANCLLEAVKLCLSCNNSIFNNESYLQIDGTTQGLAYYHTCLALMQILLCQILIREL